MEFTFEFLHKSALISNIRLLQERSNLPIDSFETLEHKSIETLEKKRYELIRIYNLKLEQGK